MLNNFVDGGSNNNSLSSALKLTACSLLAGAANAVTNAVGSVITTVVVEPPPPPPPPVVWGCVTLRQALSLSLSLIPHQELGWILTFPSGRRNPPLHELDRGGIGPCEKFCIK